MIKKQVVTMTMFSFLLAHNPNAENIEWKDYARFGGVSRGAVKNQIGFSTYYRIKRVSYNTFRDIRFYGHFFDGSPDLRIRTKSSNRYDFNPRLYHFTTYVYHKSGKNLRYHFNQGIGTLSKKIENGNMTFEIGWAYDKSDYIETDEKTTYLKTASTIDKNWEKITAKLELEYFYQISEQIDSDLSRFQTIVELNYMPSTKWGITLGIVQDNYSKPQTIDFKSNPLDIFISISRSGFIN